MTIKIMIGDSLERLRELPDDSIDSIVTDPPYGLGKEPKIADVLHAWLADQQYHAKGGGFMGNAWDAYVPGPAIWRECLRVLKPGGHLVSFFGTRTYDVGVMAVRIAGFEVRDQLGWCFSTGFPKSLDISKAIDKSAGAEREVTGRLKGAGAKDATSFGNGHQSEYDATAHATPEAEQWDGWGTALAPSYDPIVLARKPISEKTVAANVLKWGTGAINVDGCRTAGTAGKPGGKIRGKRGAFESQSDADLSLIDAPEPHALGRWPKNLLIDDSDEVAEMFPVTKGARPFVGDGRPVDTNQVGWSYKRVGSERCDDSGSATRMFPKFPRLKYCPKTSGNDRNDGLDSRSTHPTVKPTELMRWLCRLVTPPGGTVLDPFMGSGSTGRGAVLEGFSFVGCELDPAYAATAEARIREVSTTPIESEAPPEAAEAVRSPQRTLFE